MRNRRRSMSDRLVERAAAAGSWSVHEVLGMLNPVKKVLRSIAIVLAAVTLAVRLWALIYRALAFMALDSRLGVFPATKHRQAVRRTAYAGFVAAVSLKCLADGRSVTYVVWTSSIAVVGGFVGDRRALTAHSPRQRCHVAATSVIGCRRRLSLLRLHPREGL